VPAKVKAEIRSGFL